jgi:hypothetical protein
MSSTICWVSPPKRYKGDFIRLTWLKESFKTLPKGATKIVLHYYATYIMHMFGAMLFSDMIGNEVPC